LTLLPAEYAVQIAAYCELDSAPCIHDLLESRCSFCVCCAMHILAGGSLRGDKQYLPFGSLPSTMKLPQIDGFPSEGFFGLAMFISARAPAASCEGGHAN
jgi:hypothetical protein